MAARRLLCLLNFALLLMMTGLGHAEAQTTTTRFASTFDEVFSNQGKVTPVFTRPEGHRPPRA